MGLAQMRSAGNAGRVHAAWRAGTAWRAGRRTEADQGPAADARTPPRRSGMNIGIRSIGTYTPEGRMSAAEIAAECGIPEQVIREKFGVISKPVPGPDDTTSFMGTRAAEKALASGNVDPKDLDLIIWCGAQHKDYPCWLAGLKVADSIGAVNAWSFDMEAMYGSMMAAVDVAKSMMLTHDNIRRVLLVSGYRNSDLISLKEPTTAFMFDIGAGGAAMILEKGYGRNIVLASAFKGDGSFSEDCVVPVLGTRKWPPAKGDEADCHFRVTDEPSFKRKLGERTMPNFFWVIREALRLSGYTQRDIGYLAILHFKKSAHDAVLGELGIGSDRTSYLNEYGHIGQNDQILSLELGLAAGKIPDGTVVVMVGAGLGFVWAASVVRWGLASYG